MKTKTRTHLRKVRGNGSHTRLWSFGSSAPPGSGPAADEVESEPWPKSERATSRRKRYFSPPFCLFLPPPLPSRQKPVTTKIVKKETKRQLQFLFCEKKTLKAPKRKRRRRKAQNHLYSPSLPSIAESFSAQHTAALWCPLYTLIASPVARSHSLPVQSEEAVTR